jgi:ribose/xylose/arabinose/galactoside ABC-type transport system permease subunit
MGDKINKPFFKKFNELISGYVIIYAVIIIIIILSLISDVFLSVNNMMNVLRQISMTAILAAGAFFVLVCSEIDISLGSVVGLTGIIFAGAMGIYNINPIIAFMLALLVGSICGLINGILVAFFKIPSFITTLGMMSIARGLTYVLTNAVPIIGMPDSIEWLGRGYLLGIPWPVIIMVGVYIIANFVATKTKFGRFVYACGGNEESAYLSGIHVSLIKTSTFTIAGFLSAISGCILVSRLNSGQPAGGDGWEFEAITAAVLGGVSLNGGKGKVFGVFFGAVFIGLLTNGMSLLNISSYYQQIIKGIVLIMAIGIDVFKTKYQNRAK